MSRSTPLFLLALIFLASACTKSAHTPSSSNPDDEVVFALVNGREIKGKDVLEKVKTELADLKQREYEIKKGATEEAVQKLILEEEAKKQGATVDKLFSQFDSLRDRDVSKDEIKNFLKNRGVEESKLSKQERESIPQVIKMQRVYDAREKYINDLRAKANVQFKIPRPQEQRFEVDFGKNPPMGGANAKVTIVEFSDFQCPFCLEGHHVLESLFEKYRDKIRIFYRHFPLEALHPLAFKAAEASACSQDQNRFWDYHNYLFDNEGRLDQKSLIRYADDLHLDVPAFTECLNSGKKEAYIRAEMADGLKVGVSSTPTFFINGRVVRGSSSMQGLSEIIDDELAR